MFTTYYRLLFWLMLWGIVWPFMLLFKRNGKTNCLEWAMSRWSENPEGYFVIRWSRTNFYHLMRWPHFLFLQPNNNDNLEHIHPFKRDTKKQLIPAIWFEPDTLHGDTKEVTQNDVQD